MADPSEDAGTPPGSPAPPQRLARRVRPNTSRQPNAADMDTLARLAATMRAMSASGQAAGPASNAGGGPAAHKGHRFQRGAPLEKHAEETPLSLPAGLMTAPERQQSTSVPEGMARPARRSRPRSSKLAALRKHPFLVWAVVQIFCFGLIMLGFFLGAMETAPAPAKAAAPALPSAPQPAAAMAAMPTGTPSAAAVSGALDTISVAFEKERTGDFPAALALLQSLGQPPLALPGTEYQLAMLALRAGNPVHEKLHLDRSLAAGQQMAPCYYLRAALAGANGDYQTASAQLRLAAEAEPFTGRYFFYWGEALRRNGQFPEAVAALRQALTRPITGERVLYSFKFRLAQIEAGNAPFIAALEDRLRQPAPTGDWLLLAAAQNLQRHAPSAAAQFMQRAAGLLAPDILNTCEADFAFQNYAGEPEIAKLLAAAAAAAGSDNSIVLDPTLAAPASADPALWRHQQPAR
jgi:hypothetical protein